ncbi:MAG TPA: HAD-IC family P-type ATPase, partial [Aggregatilineales bacterium]|nr:HAD-IC family P-type ATPase [Aggregatilineales bacterium]
RRYPHAPAVCEDALRHENQGQTVMMVADSDKVIGFISVADTPRKVAKDSLARLRDMHTVMLTGDNQNVARAIAAQVGINEVKAELLPDQKAGVIQALVREYGAAAMIGDGVNDAPALAAATVGIAMGGAGTAQAMETADVVLMKDDLSQLPIAIDISRQAARIIKQNIGLSLLIKAIFVALTLPGLTTLWMAVFADVGMSLLVTFNGMRMLRVQDR